MNNSTSKLIIGFVTGISLMLMINYFHSPKDENKNNSAAITEKKPLYWVAPMDANFRRDKPGKSPMGMDLVPFYGDDGVDIGEGPGTIKISPNVVNNLGVKTAKAKMLPLNTEIITVGYVQYDEDKIVHIHPRVEGWIENLYVKALGDRVEKNQVLYEIYSPELVNAQQELVLALERKNNQLISAAKNRLKSLHIPESIIQELIKTKSVKQNVAFYAPQSGFVDNLNIRQGYFVEPGKTLMSISKLDSVWVEALVYENQAHWVNLETQVSMTVDFLPGKEWKGEVDYIYPQLDAKTRTLKVRLKFKNFDYQLKPNMFASVTMHVKGDKKLLMVPQSAVIRTGKMNRIVLAMGQGQFKSIKVEIGDRDNKNIEILSGITHGEEVVVSAQFLLDSESSKTSDFMRMSHNQTIGDSDNKNESIPTATTKGKIISISKDFKRVSIDREAIEKWNRPAAIVDFLTDEQLDISHLSNRDDVMFTFEIQDGEFIITEISQLSSL
ncbi:MAG: efflux RND transporter periplasmic adaptor subunit [Marinicellaceae bacterium]